MIARNLIDGAGNNGIQVWRTASGDDGSIVVNNRISNIGNRSRSGQYGNGINVFRAANVVVRGNRIKNCAFSAVRGNSASNLHIEGNAISDMREVALYAEFAFEGAVVANNSVEGAAIGVAITNFNAGGRLAVVQGNIIRNLLPERPAGADPGRRGRDRNSGRGGTPPVTRQCHRERPDCGNPAARLRTLSEGHCGLPATWCAKPISALRYRWCRAPGPRSLPTMSSPSVAARLSAWPGRSR